MSPITPPAYFPVLTRFRVIPQSWEIITAWGPCWITETEILWRGWPCWNSQVRSGESSGDLQRPAWASGCWGVQVGDDRMEALKAADWTIPMGLEVIFPTAKRDSGFTRGLSRVLIMDILLSHKKKRNWVIRSEVDGVRVCHTEWSKSEREKQIQYANTYIWNLRGKKRSWRT